MPKKEGVIEAEGVVVQQLPGTTFKVRLDNGHIIIAYASGRIWKHSIRIIEGDRVKVEISPYDLTKGRIIWRIG
jgi:translation initiation factor IF-1